MTRLRLVSVALIAALMVVGGLGASFASAQDASPEASSECQDTTVDENIQIVTDAVAAIDSADAEKIDELFADDYTDIGSRFGLPVDETSNDDEIALAQALLQLYPGATTTIDDIFGVDNKVVVLSTYTISAHTATGEKVTLGKALQIKGVGVFTIECGEIAHADSLLDSLTLLTAIGVLNPASGTPTAEATPTS